MTYKEAIEYMYSQLPMFQRVGKSAYRIDLTNVLTLCESLGNPQNELKCIHIAGTNGKGSVSHLLSAVLQAHGYKTGLYISPHYKDYRERIKVNGEYITKKFVVRFLEENRILFDQIKPSFFEMTVALAFCYFKDQKVDYSVIETGLGGRLDATNIISPIMSIITNISLDHADILGDTLEKIATEKAGIIKSHTPVIIGRRQIETEGVFKQKALLEHANLYYAEDNIFSEFNTNNDGISRIRFNDEIEFIPDLKGPFQLENYRTVFAACKILNQENRIELKIDKIKSAFQHTTDYSKIMGRWQWKEGIPKILLESAHNLDGIQFLMSWLNQQHYDEQHIVIGFVNDKPLDQVLNLLPKNAHYYFVNAQLPRALKASELKEKAALYNLRGKGYKSVKNGFLAAKKKAGKNDIIVVTGSIFVVAEVI
ncbi:MAG TPA: folylpolyglutamate synthase/dihydrofolate synthase family protein [Saprospiraceae bacterium]|nr:folylpolyglutamate synthase/dihydrofolate synthase family protein [Saprospiraceae bacterium]